MNAPKLPEPITVDGAAVLDELRTVLTDYVVLPNTDAVDAVVLWIAATHCLPAFDHATRLVIRSPEKRCGKSRLLEVIADTCRNALVTVNVTEAALFRSIGDDPPTLLLDEFDAMFGSKTKADQNEGIRGLLNAGYRRGLTTLRTVGPLHTPTEFPTFAMAALAGIGTMPDTIEDRAVIITMRRRAPGETVRPYRFRRDRPRLLEVRDRIAEWAASVVEDLGAVEPVLPLEDRAADTWEPLVAVADAAGGHWPTQARKAAVAMVNVSAAEDTQSGLNTKLLGDIRDAFAADGKEFLSSRDLVELLRLVEESPWADFNLNTNGLARRLLGYGVRPRPDTAGKVRGYHLASFTDAFTRYLPVRVSEASEPVRGQQTRGISSDGSAPSDTLNRQTPAHPSDQNPREHGSLTLSDGSDAQVAGTVELVAASRAPGNPVCQICGKPNLFARVSIERGICAGCVKVLAEHDTTEQGHRA